MFRRRKDKRPSWIVLTLEQEALCVVLEEQFRIAREQIAKENGSGQ